MSVTPRDSRWVVGWDVGGAHLKACLLRDGQAAAVVQRACPLWQGLQHLDAAIDAVLAAWPAAQGARHGVTMTGEMVDLFANRRDGVERIAARLVGKLPTPPHFYAGRNGWCSGDAAARRWQQVASANWLATAQHAALRVGSGVLVDVGSTTTDLVAFDNGRVITQARSDAERLASGELVYHGVVRTPLCAVARRVRWRGVLLNVMNEFFATSADVYRLTGELDPEHDQHPAADNAAKDKPGTQQRLARMVGLDAQDGSDADWLAFARAWRAEQVAELAGQLERVLAAQGVAADAPLVSAGCGGFLVRSLAEHTQRRCVDYAAQVARIAPDAAPHTARWAQVCAPSVAVAALLDEPAS